jgi:hypothetical protein
MPTDGGFSFEVITSASKALPLLSRIDLATPIRMASLNCPLVWPAMRSEAGSETSARCMSTTLMPAAFAAAICGASAAGSMPQTRATPS